MNGIDEDAVLRENRIRLRNLTRRMYVLTPLKGGGEAWFKAPTLARWDRIPFAAFHTPRGTVTRDGIKQAIRRLQARMGPSTQCRTIGADAWTASPRCQ